MSCGDFCTNMCGVDAKTWDLSAHLGSIPNLKFDLVIALPLRRPVNSPGKASNWAQTGMAGTLHTDSTDLAFELIRTKRDLSNAEGG